MAISTRRPSESRPVMSQRVTHNKTTKPKKPLSAYNIFYSHCRERLLAAGADKAICLTATPEDVARLSREHKKKPKRAHRTSEQNNGRISFLELARTIGGHWRKLSAAQKSIFEQQAQIEKQEYDEKMKEWNRAQVAKGVSSVADYDEGDSDGSMEFYPPPSEPSSPSTATTATAPVPAVAAPSADPLPFLPFSAESNANILHTSASMTALGNNNSSNIDNLRQHHTPITDPFPMQERICSTTTQPMPLQTHSNQYASFGLGMDAAACFSGTQQQQPPANCYSSQQQQQFQQQQHFNQQPVGFAVAPQSIPSPANCTSARSTTQSGVDVFEPLDLQDNQDHGLDSSCVDLLNNLFQ